MVVLDDDDVSRSQLESTLGSEADSFLDKMVRAFFEWISGSDPSHNNATTTPRKNHHHHHHQYHQNNHHEATREGAGDSINNDANKNRDVIVDEVVEVLFRPTRENTETKGHTQTNEENRHESVRASRPRRRRHADDNDNGNDNDDDSWRREGRTFGLPQRDVDFGASSAPFQCPGDGFYADPNDCTIFYHCSNGKI
jgi:hypothetical protein